MLWSSKTDPMPLPAGGSQSSQYKIKVSTQCFAKSIFLLKKSQESVKYEVLLFPVTEFGPGSSQ